MSEEGTLMDSFYQQRIYEQVMSNLSTEEDMIFFKSLKPKLYKDGDKWCCLYGENIQVGIVGFGGKPIDAIRKFNQEMYREENTEEKKE